MIGIKSFKILFENCYHLMTCFFYHVKDTASKALHLSKALYLGTATVNCTASIITLYCLLLAGDPGVIFKLEILRQGTSDRSDSRLGPIQ